MDRRDRRSAGQRKLSARRIVGLRKAAAEAMAANWSADGNALVFRRQGSEYDRYRKGI